MNATKDLPRRIKVLLLAQTLGEAVALAGLTWLLLFGTPLAVLGIVTSSMSIVVKWTTIGQIRRLLRIKNSRQLSYWFYGIAPVSYLSYTCFGIRTDNVVLWVSQMFGVPGTLVVLHLIVRYRIVPPKTTREVVRFWVWDDPMSQWEEVSAIEFRSANQLLKPSSYPGEGSYWTGPCRGTDEIIAGIATIGPLPSEPCREDLMQSRYVPPRGIRVV